jgi:hypothetical protein
LINDLGQNLAATGGVAETALNCASGGTNPDYENYGYDPNSNRTTLRVRSGQQITFAYDNPNREEFKDIPNETAGDVNTGDLPW